MVEGLKAWTERSRCGVERMKGLGTRHGDGGQYVHHRTLPGPSRLRSKCLGLAYRDG